MTMTDSALSRFATLPAVDRRLLVAMSAASLVALALGILGGLLTGFARAGWIDVIPNTGYRLLTVHGVSIFFYWLFIAQGALLCGFAAVESGAALRWRRAAWSGFGLMLAGFAVSLTGAHLGFPLLYDGSPELAADSPSALGVFNLGYLLLGLGLMVLPISAIATVLHPRRQGRQDRLSAVGFALFAWAGFLMVSGFAALYTFLPGLLWALGAGPFPLHHGTNWHIVFHNLHYLPLMATVILWYVVVRELTGVKSVFGERFSKVVFSSYLVFVPPTSLYHMFLEPDLPGAVRVGGSLLSLFVSVPTLTAFLIIVASLEVHARSRGGRGLFGWIRLLPWGNPAMSAIGAAVLAMGAGIALAFVLIQERLAPLLSDTFFVPAYFHFFTVGTVSLTLLAGLALMLPAVGGRPLWRPRLLAQMPWVVLAGLAVFGAAGVAAGLFGVPRRMIDLGHLAGAPEAWPVLMVAVGIGATVMALALALLAAGVATSLLPQPRSVSPGSVPTVAWGGDGLRPGVTAWVGPVSVLAIVVAMYVLTVLGFELMRALPITATGGFGH
jgi:cytochrome c oxidase subunit I